MLDIDNILEKYEKCLLDNLNTENINKIIEFLIYKKCDFIEELLEDYMDLFSFNYADFINKFDILNRKYNNEFLNYASFDMNIFEEFYTI